jgi:cytochrome c biogenesis factor
MRTGLVGLSVIMGFILLVCITNELEIFGVKFWGVRKEEARREVFKQTPSYVQGKIQELTKYRLEYNKAKDEDEKEYYRETAIISMANVDENKLPADLRQFLNELKK